MREAAVSGSDPLGESEKPYTWKMLPFSGVSEKARLVALRLNSLADPFFLAKVVLGMERMTSRLHGSWLRTLSDAALKLVLEAPRDHFKSSCGVVTAIWWSLPFANREEDWMRSLGAPEEWIRYMRRVHSVNTRTLICSQTEENAIKIGTRIERQYTANEVFRSVFSDVIPETGARWNQLSMTQKRESDAGEGTYEFMGAGSALQSRHYDRAIEDDLFGEKALYSPSVAEQVIEWHQRLPGAFDTDILAPGFRNLELVIGNRWGIHDLNAWIRENNPSFRFETHSAEGGCCAAHPAGEPIFPEEFSMERLAEYRQRFGVRSYSAHFLNQPVTEEELSFRQSWLPRFRLEKKQIGVDSNGGGPAMATMIERLPGTGGEVHADLAVKDLKRILVLDPNHGGETGRARHAAVVVALRRREDGKHEIYLLECWAKSVSHNAMIEAVGAMASRWHVNKFYVEVIAGQDGWMHYFETAMREKEPSMVVEALPKERGAGAKERRILSMSGYYERGQVWVRSSGGGSELFMEEYSLHPQSRTVDLLDCMGYLFHLVESPEVDYRKWSYLADREAERRRRSIGKAGY